MTWLGIECCYVTDLIIQCRASSVSGLSWSVFSGRTAVVASLGRLPASAGGMIALSVVAWPSLVGPVMSVPVPGIPGTTGASAEGCVMAYSMALIAILVCCRAVASGIVVIALCALDGLVRCSHSVLEYWRSCWNGCREGCTFFTSFESGLLELLATCDTSDMDLVMYLMVNLGFVNYFDNLVESLDVPILKNWTTQEQFKLYH